MKMIIAIVQDKDSNNLSNAFVEADVRATKLATTGGFLRSGNTTFMIGIEDERVAEVLALIKHASSRRAEYITPPVNVEGQVYLSGRDRSRWGHRFCFTGRTVLSFLRRDQLERKNVQLIIRNNLRRENYIFSSHPVLMAPHLI